MCVDLTCGDILRIDKQGHQERSNFDTSKLFHRIYEPWMDSGFQSIFCDTNGDNESRYLEDLKSIAMFYGLFPKDIDSLINDGVDSMKIEEMLFCG